VAPPSEGKMQIFPFFNSLQMAHLVYIIYSDSIDKFYVGETVNVAERLNQHNVGVYKAAFSKQATDWQLFWSIGCHSRSQALKIEKHIKKMRNRKYFENLIKYPEISQKLLKLYKE
jgi:putative endonuclease